MCRRACNGKQGGTLGAGCVRENVMVRQRGTLGVGCEGENVMVGQL